MHFCLLAGGKKEYNKKRKIHTWKLSKIMKKKDKNKYANSPIVLTAFGTTTKALDTYAVMDKAIKQQFPGHKIIWAYSSRMVKDHLTDKGVSGLKHPGQVLDELAAEGYAWAVVQSMHLICGHEFYRMVEEVQQKNIRTSIGLPLLTEHKDYEKVISHFTNTLQSLENQAVLFIGHGTDHPAWSSYLALSHMLCEKFGDRIYMGVVEGYPEKNEIVNKIVKSKIKKVLLIPFMLVAGRHLLDDIAGDDGSWKTALEEKGIYVSIRSTGLGMMPGIQKIFCSHIKDARDIILPVPLKTVE